jgi:preprotein translocase subunit Sec61beta
MAEPRFRMPSGTGGLVRYFDDYKSKIAFQPLHVIVFIVLVMLLVIILHIFGLGLLGF